MPLWQSEQQPKLKLCAAAAVGDATAEDAFDECAIPRFGGPPRFEFPDCPQSIFKPIVEEFTSLFRVQPGVTTVALHCIPTTGPSVRVPLRRVPVHYREEVERQIQEMLEQGVIEESSSPWLAPMRTRYL